MNRTIILVIFVDPLKAVSPLITSALWSAASRPYAFSENTLTESFIAVCGFTTLFLLCYWTFSEVHKHVRSGPCSHDHGNFGPCHHDPVQDVIVSCLVRCDHVSCVMW